MIFARELSQSEESWGISLVFPLRRRNSGIRAMETDFPVRKHRRHKPPIAANLIRYLCTQLDRLQYKSGTGASSTSKLGIAQVNSKGGWGRNPSVVDDLAECPSLSVQFSVNQPRTRFRVLHFTHLFLSPDGVGRNHSCVCSVQSRSNGARLFASNNRKSMTSYA